MPSSVDVSPRCGANRRANACLLAGLDLGAESLRSISAAPPSVLIALRRDPPSVDVNDLAGDVPRGGPGEEKNRSYHVVRIGKPAKRNARDIAGQTLAKPRVGAGPAATGAAGQKGGVDRAW